MAAPGSSPTSVRSAPLLASIYLGGPGYDNAWSSAVDARGNVYVAGDTQQAGFPATTRALQRTFAGGGQDGFVAKFDKSGKLLWSTLLGGSGWDGVYGVSVDPAGDALVTGVTGSADFPVAGNAVQRTLAGGDDAFVSVISPDGTQLRYSTYLGGKTSDGVPLPVNPYHVLPPSDDADLGIAVTSGPDGSLYSTLLGGSSGGSASSGNNATDGNAIAVDSQGDAYVAGNTNDTDFPTTPGVAQPASGGVDDGFVSELSPGGSSLVFSTYLGGSDYEGFFGLARDPNGNILLAGFTSSHNLPQVQPFQAGFGGFIDAWVAELSGDGRTLLRSSYLGGSDQDLAYGIGFWSGRIYVAGVTASKNFPVTSRSPQTVYGGGVGDAFLAIVQS